MVAEAVVNDVAHRDYTSNGSVQVMLFSDRLEVWNPGRLPPSLTLEKLRQAHGSVPGNPLLAEPMYLTGYVERMGTGTRDMIRRGTKIGLPEPKFAVSDGFQTIIRRARGKEPGRETREKILALIAADPTISTHDLAERIGITPKGIEWQLRQLRQAGRLKRVGPRKGGRGEVVGEE